MPGGFIDLHCHSTASDGRLAPRALVERALAIDLKALALTDHDTVGGIAAFSEAAEAKGLESVAGVEVSALFERGTMHIVGLFVDPSNEGFLAFLKKLSEGRNIRNPKILEKLRGFGVEISMEEVEEEAGIGGVGGGAIDKSVGRPHIASVLIRKGYVKDKNDAFERYLAKGKPCYVSRFVASPEETIRQIHDASGLAILAHPPYLKAENDDELEKIVAGLKEQGLDGIEVQYSTHSPEQTALCRHFAEKYDLVPSGGSDFHGEPPAGDGCAVQLGTGIGGALRIPYSVLEALRVRWEKRR